MKAKGALKKWAELPQEPGLHAGATVITRTTHYPRGVRLDQLVMLLPRGGCGGHRAEIEDLSLSISIVGSGSCFPPRLHPVALNGDLVFVEWKDCSERRQVLCAMTGKE